MAAPWTTHEGSNIDLSLHEVFGIGARHLHVVVVHREVHPVLGGGSGLGFLLGVGTVVDERAAQAGVCVGTICSALIAGIAVKTVKLSTI